MTFLRGISMDKLATMEEYLRTTSSGLRQLFLIPGTSLRQIF